MAEAYDEGVVSEVIRPAAIIPEESARAVLVELALRDVQNGGVWQSEPSLWSRYDRAVGGLRLPRRRRADRDHPGRLRHADPLRDHDLPGHGHAVRHRAGLDRRGAVQRGPRLRQPGPRQLPPGVAERAAEAVPVLSRASLGQVLVGRRRVAGRWVSRPAAPGRRPSSGRPPGRPCRPCTGRSRRRASPGRCRARPRCGWPRSDPPTACLAAVALGAQLSWASELVPTPSPQSSRRPAEDALAVGPAHHQAGGLARHHPVRGLDRDPERRRAGRVGCRRGPWS